MEKLLEDIRKWAEKEIEFGIVETSWIKQPLESGTHKVLSDGFKVIVDKKEYFKDLVIE